MQLTLSYLAGLAALASFGSAAVIDLYTDTGCTQGKREITVGDGGCWLPPADGNFYAATQNIGDNGIRYTCDAFSDNQCKNKIHEVYHCSGSDGSAKILGINCYANPPL